VVKHLIAINVILFLGIELLNQPGIKSYLTFHHPMSGRFEPVQIISHMFMHADPGHLFFNMLSLFFLGPTIENHLGPKKFLILYFVAGFGGLLAHLAIGGGNSVLGASGAIYGVFAAFAMYFPNVQLMLIFPPIPIKAKYMVLMFIGYDLFYGVSGAITRTAHFAHLGGALFAVLIILYWRKFGK